MSSPALLLHKPCPSCSTKADRHASRVYSLGAHATAIIWRVCAWRGCLMEDVPIVCRWLRDEALSDGMLYATSPCLEDPI